MVWLIIKDNHDSKPSTMTKTDNSKWDLEQPNGNNISATLKLFIMGEFQ